MCEKVYLQSGDNCGHLYPKYLIKVFICTRALYKGGSYGACGVGTSDDQPSPYPYAECEACSRARKEQKKA